MTRRITCYVVFVTLIWGAHTEDEEEVRDMFKSNMTRNDFSNLLQSLIKLNEKRVSVLQKLYRLEDYGVLSEVLRSDEKKTGNGNPNKLFLIVMSKNPNNPSRRKDGFQVVDSVTSLDAGNNNIHPKLDFVLDPAGYISQNIRKENRLESIFANVPREYGPTRQYRADDESKKNTTTTTTLNYGKPGLRTEVKNDRAKTSFKANDRKHHKENNKIEILSNKGRRPDASEKLLDYDGNSNKYHQTVGYNSQSNEYLEKDFTIENDKLTTKPIIINHISSSNHKYSKYPLEDTDELDEDDYGSSFSNNKNDHKSPYTSNKKLHGNNRHNPETNKYTPKVKVQSNQKNYKLTTKPIKQIKHIISGNHKKSKYPLEVKDELDEDDYGSPFSNNKNDHKSPYISSKKLHGNNHHNPKTNKYTPKVKVQSQQNDKLTTKPTIKDMLSSNRQNKKYPLEGKYEQDEDIYGSPFRNIENDHNSQYTNINSKISINKLHDNNNHYNPKSNKNTAKVKDQSNQRPKLNQYIKSNLNNQGIKHSKINTPIDIETTTRKKYYRIIGTVNKASENNNSIKNANFNNANKHDHIHTKIKHIYATKEIDSNNKFLTIARENVYGSKPVIPETTEDTQYGSYPGFEANKDIRDNPKKDKPKTAEDTPYGNYLGLEHHKDVRGNSYKGKSKIAEDTLYGNYPGLKHHKDVMDNLNKNKPNTSKELHYGDNLNAESKKDIYYDGVKMFDNVKKSGEKFTVFITNVGNGTAEEVKQQNYPKLILNAFDQPERKPIARKPFVKCLNKKALKLCSKSCISAYKNVCRRLKCTSRSKKALKTECKRSCQKTFASSSSKYENSDEYSDESYSDYD